MLALIEFIHACKVLCRIERSLKEHVGGLEGVVWVHKIHKHIKKGGIKIRKKNSKRKRQAAAR